MSKDATGQQKQISGQQQDFMSTLQNDFGTAFAGSQNIINGLTKSLQTTLAAGPNQFGFSAPELAAMNTLATTQNANAYRQARAAAGAAAAASGGGANLPTGALAGTQAALAEKAGEQQSNSLLGIQEAGYKQGTENYENAVKNLQGTASLENPTGLANTANTAGSQAFDSATTLYKQKQAASPWGQLGGLAGSLAGAALNLAVPGAGSSFSTLGKAITSGYSNAAGMSTADDLSSSLSIEPKQIQTLGNLPSF